MNSCPKEKTVAKAKQSKKKLIPHWLMFVLFMPFPACPHLHACLHSPWFYVTTGVKMRDHLRCKFALGSHIFSSQKYKSCTWSICAEVSGDFHPNFHYRYFCVAEAIGFFVCYNHFRTLAPKLREILFSMLCIFFEYE